MAQLWTRLLKTRLLLDIFAALDFFHLDIQIIMEMMQNNMFLK